MCATTYSYVTLLVHTPVAAALNARECTERAEWTTATIFSDLLCLPGRRSRRRWLCRAVVYPTVRHVCACSIHIHTCTCTRVTHTITYTRICKWKIKECGWRWPFFFFVILFLNTTKGLPLSLPCGGLCYCAM